MAICWRTNEGSIYHVQIQEPCIAGGVTSDGCVRAFAIVERKRANSLCLKNRTISRQPPRQVRKSLLVPRFFQIVQEAIPFAIPNFQTFRVQSETRTWWPKNSRIAEFQ